MGCSLHRADSGTHGDLMFPICFGASPRAARASAADFLVGAAESAVTVKSFRESYFPYVGTQIKDFFEELKRSVTPDVIFCHHRHDLHQDHRVIAELAWNTF